MYASCHANYRPSVIVCLNLKRLSLFFVVSFNFDLSVLKDMNWLTSFNGLMNI